VINPWWIAGAFNKMNIKILKFISVLLILCASCTESPIDEKKGKDIADKMLQKPSTAKLYSQINVDISILPPPKLEYQGNMLLVDYEDVSQNISIIVMVHPDGSTEISHMKIKQ
jgi:hypothetical protein